MRSTPFHLVDEETSMRSDPALEPTGSLRDERPLPALTAADADKRVKLTSRPRRTNGELNLAKRR